MAVDNMAPLIVRTSDRGTFRRCRRLWHFTSKSDGRLGLEPKRRVSVFWLGTAVHYALQHYYIPGRVRGGNLTVLFNDYVRQWTAVYADEMREWGAEEIVSMDSDVGMGLAILSHYQVVADRIDDFEVLQAEQVFHVPVRHPNGQPLMIRWGDEFRPVVHEGRFDLLIRDSYGRIYIMDHKTHNRKVDERKLANDDQIGSYLWAAQAAGYERIEGFIYNVLYKRVPMAPDVVYKGTKKERLSRADATLNTTTYDLYLDTIEQNGYDPLDYADELAYLEEAGYSSFFERMTVGRTPTELGEIGTRIFMESLDMFSENLLVYPNPNFTCPNCPFLSPCLAMSGGNDWRTILAENYRPRETFEEGDHEWMPA